MKLLKEESESVLEKVDAVLEEIGEKPLIIKDVCRIGGWKPGTIRPAKFSLTSSDHVKQVLTTPMCVAATHKGEV